MADMDLWSWITLIALGVVTVITRGFFFLSDKDWQLPHWAERGLQYAPIAALAAVVAPDVLMRNGHWITSWREPHLYAALVAVAWMRWRGGVLGAMVSGMAVYLPLHLGLGW